MAGLSPTERGITIYSFYRDAELRGARPGTSQRFERALARLREIDRAAMAELHEFERNLARS